MYFSYSLVKKFAPDLLPTVAQNCTILTNQSEREIESCDL